MRVQFNILTQFRGFGTGILPNERTSLPPWEPSTVNSRSGSCNAPGINQ
jgi:hypothetical protein